MTPEDAAKALLLVGMAGTVGSLVVATTMAIKGLLKGHRDQRP